MTWNREPLEQHELEQLLTAANDKGLKFDFTCRTLAYTGLRVGEFAHMRDDWIDWQEEVLRVPKQQGDWTPKTDQAARTIPLPPQRPAVKRVMAEYFKYNEQVGVTRQAVHKRVKSVAQETDITKKVTPHVLRHTYGTLLARNKATSEYIKKTMGHAHLSTSEQYIDYSGTQLKQEAQEVWD